MDCWLYKPKNYFLKKVGIEKNPFHDSAPFKSGRSLYYS